MLPRMAPAPLRGAPAPPAVTKKTTTPAVPPETYEDAPEGTLYQELEEAAKLVTPGAWGE